MPWPGRHGAPFPVPLSFTNCFSEANQLQENQEMTSVSKYLRGIALSLAATCLIGLTSVAHAEDAAQRAEIDAAADAAIAKMVTEDRRAKRIADEAVAMLVFPEIAKAGLGIGGEFGKGVLRVGGDSVGYYKTSSISIGAQAGAQTYGYAILFFSDKALEKFTSRRGFEVGVDASIAIVEAGVTADIDTTDLKFDTVGIVFDERGLMANATVEGSKISELDI